MFDELLPTQADLRKLAAKEADFSVCLDVAKFSRLADALYEGKGLINADLHLGVDEENVRFIKGEVQCLAKVICQRCLEPVEIKFGSEVNLAIVLNEESVNELSSLMDPLVVGMNQLIDLNEVVEDELLLSLPYVSYHDFSVCGESTQYKSETEAPIVIEKKENPFSVLASLKIQDDKTQK